MASIRTATSVNGAITKDTSTMQPIEAPEVDLVAWFAKNMPTPAGPENNVLLPGLVLETNFNNGEIINTAIDIKQTIDPKNIKEPQKGKRIIQFEYRKMMMDFMKNQSGSAIRMGAM